MSIGTIVAGVIGIIAMTLASIVALAVLHDQTDIAVVVAFTGPTLLGLLAVLKIDQVSHTIANGSMDAKMQNAVKVALSDNKLLESEDPNHG